MIPTQRSNLLAPPDTAAILASFRAGTFGEAQLATLLAGYASVQEIARNEWQPASTAPTDRVIDAVVKFKDATAGAPAYVSWFHDAWRELGRDITEPLDLLCWRERTDFPQFLRFLPSHPLSAQPLPDAP